MRDQLGRPAQPMPASTANLNVIELWPELFDGVNDVVAQAIQDACVATWHEGWKPNRPRGTRFRGGEACMRALPAPNC